MTAVLRRICPALLLALGCASLLAASAGASGTAIHSGNAVAGNLDPFITYVNSPSCGVGFPAAFTAADFAAAASGPQAIVVNAHPAWTPGIPCDPKARWISTGINYPPFSTLYAQKFDVPECCISHATLNMCWSADDDLGDQLFGPGPNPMGVYVNGVAVPITGGNYGAQTISGVVDITALVHCGINYLYTYDRDAGCAVSGEIYQAQIEVQGCSDAVQRHTWGAVRKIYR